MKATLTPKVQPPARARTYPRLVERSTDMLGSYGVFILLRDDGDYVKNAIRATDGELVSITPKYYHDYSGTVTFENND